MRWIPWLEKTSLDTRFRSIANPPTTGGGNATSIIASKHARKSTSMIPRRLLSFDSSLFSPPTTAILHTQWTQRNWLYVQIIVFHLRSYSSRRLTRIHVSDRDPTIEALLLHINRSLYSTISVGSYFEPFLCSSFHQLGWTSKVLPRSSLQHRTCPTAGSLGASHFDTR